MCLFRRIRLPQNLWQSSPGEVGWTPGCWLIQRPVGKKWAPWSTTTGAVCCGEDREQRWTPRNWRRRRLLHMISFHIHSSLEVGPTPIATEHQSCRKWRPSLACKQAADLGSTLTPPRVHFPDNEGVIIELSLSPPLQVPSELFCCTYLITTRAGLQPHCPPQPLTSTLIWLAPNECDAKLKDARRHCRESNELASIYYVLNSIRFFLQSSLNIHPADGYRVIPGRGYYHWIPASAIQLGFRWQCWAEDLSVGMGRSRKFKTSCQGSCQGACIFPVGEGI